MSTGSGWGVMKPTTALPSKPFISDNPCLITASDNPPLPILAVSVSTAVYQVTMHFADLLKTTLLQGGACLPSAFYYEEVPESMMYNMTTQGLLGVAESGATPRTPEIVNSLMSMTNPFDRLRTTANSPQSEASNSPPSVQHTCSQLIKEGLKLTIQSKRRTISGGEGSPLLGGRSGGGNTSPESQHCDTSNDGLTPEDEERRRRRRERNKIAATKCRQKKRERTNNLVYESEALETQNLDLKSKIQELESQRRTLVDILATHRPNCNKQQFVSSSAVYHEYSRAEYSGSNYPSSSYDVCSENSSTSFHRTVIEEIGYTNPYLYKDRTLRDSIIPYSQQEMQSADIIRMTESGSYPVLEGGQQYPLRLAASTSSSDYESNTELLDSPSASYQFPDDPPSYSSSSSSVFPTTSCIR